jgi:hypothetical protein
LLRDFELDWSLRLLLHEGRSRDHVTSHADVLNLKRVKSHARSLLSMARLNIANSRALEDICSLVRIAHISRSFNGGFWPVSLPLFHGTRRAPEEVSVSMTISSSTKGD